jgi:hypothetical protein
MHLYVAGFVHRTEEWPSMGAWYVICRNLANLLRSPQPDLSIKLGAPGYCRCSGPCQ